MNIKELEIDIKKELRASMNGILSARMRNAGMPFRLIYGVELPRLRNIATEFPQDATLANHLWQLNIRETRLLAIMLMPVDDFTTENATSWAETMVTAEEAQILAMVLLPKHNEAGKLCLFWLKEGKALPATSACLCLRHMLHQGNTLKDEDKEQVEKYMSELEDGANLHLKKAILALREALTFGTE